METYVRTTINHHITTLRLIQKISEKTGLSENEIIVYTLNRLIRDKGRENPVHLKQVKYQEGDPGNYVPRPLKLTVYQYEYYSDIRKLFKMSSSYLIAIALRMFYKLFIDSKIELGCSFVLKHALKGIFIDGVQVWIQHWGEIKEPFTEMYSYTEDPG